MHVWRCVLASALLGACGGRPALERADVLLVYVDTLRADRPGFAGHAAAETANLDRLAREGVHFRRAYAPSPWTFPSTASLFTGLYPDAHVGGIEGAPRDLRETPRPRQLGPAFTTLAETLREHGYRTALFAANPYLKQGNQQGFEHVDVDKERAAARVDAALAWLAGRGDDEPWFLALHFIDVHEPNLPPGNVLAESAALRGLGADEIVEASRWRKRYAGREPPPSGPEFQRHRERRAALYDAALHYVDLELARLLAAARERAGERPLLLVFTADHGEEFWEHAELERARFEDPRGLYGVGHGHTLFEELGRVPLLFHAPGLIAPGAVDAPVSLVDVLPTIVELVGARHAGPLQGRSLVPALAGGALDERPLFFGEPCFGGDQRGVLAGGLKLIASEQAGSFLFDLAADPREANDLAGRSDPRLSELAQRLERFGDESRALRASLGAPAAEAAEELSPADLESLQELGYLGGEAEED